MAKSKANANQIREILLCWGRVAAYTYAGRPSRNQLIYPDSLRNSCIRGTQVRLPSNVLPTAHPPIAVADPGRHLLQLRWLLRLLMKWLRRRIQRLNRRSASMRSKRLISRNGGGLRYSGIGACRVAKMISF